MNSLFLIDRREESVALIDLLRATEEKKAAGPQGKVKNIEGAMLRVGFQVDEQIAANDQIEPGKGRIAQHVMGREEDQFTDVFFHPISAVVLGKKAAQPFLRNVRFDR